MKSMAHSLAMVVAVVSSLAAAEVEVGATLDEVRAALGTPKGQAVAGDRQVIYYERGDIELREGRVIRVGLRSAEEHAAHVEREERMRVEREASRAELLAEGTAVRDRKLADVSFQAAPVAFQVAYWENFARSYPGVPVMEPLTVARMRLNEELEEKLRRNEEIARLAELEEGSEGEERVTVYRHVGYPRRRGSHGHHPHQPFALGPVTYEFFDAPLPVYTTPTTPLINPFRGDLAQPQRRENDTKESRRDRWHDGRRQERGARDGNDGTRGRQWR